jgi:hypothetical protein
VEAPKYQLVNPLYAYDEFIPEGEIIETDEDFIPNEGMIPLNEVAKLKVEEFLAKVNGGTPDLGDIVENAYRKRPRHEIDPIVPPDRKVIATPSATKPPLTGYDGNTGKMTRKRESKVKSVGVAGVDGGVTPKKVMGDVSHETARGI